MIVTRHLVNDGFVAVMLRAPPAPVYGLELTFSLDGQTWRPCAVYPARDVDALLELSFWTWNQAVEFGRVKFNGVARPCYWNLYLNGLHRHDGPLTLRADVLLETGPQRFDAQIELRPSRAVYLDTWARWVAPGSGWQTDAGVLRAEPGRAVPPLRVPAGVRGRYEIHVGLRGKCVAAFLKLSHEAHRRPFWVQAKHPEVEDKASKEIVWKTADFAPDTAIEISPFPVSVREPKVTPGGSIAYIKLVPVRRRRAPAAAPAQRTLALYFEPYSWAFYYDTTEPAHVREAMTLYKEMGATEVHNQVIRFGSKALHHSRVAERYVEGRFMADDGTYSDAPAEMVRRLDVLRCAIDACRELGLTHVANAGLTNCYPNSGLEDRISREHPEWRTGNVLRYNRPETRALAAAVMAEFVEWGTDALSIDCMRYPDHHTEEELVLLFREIRASVDAAARGRKIPLTVRLPAGDPVYYRAFETLVRAGAVQGVAPSTVWPREPYTSVKPYLRWKDHGCRVLGVIDGWKTWVGTFVDNFQLELMLAPRDIRADIDRHLRDGADGIFVYQADQHCADPFTRHALSRVFKT